MHDHWSTLFTHVYLIIRNMRNGLRPLPSLFYCRLFTDEDPFRDYTEPCLVSKVIASDA